MLLLFMVVEIGIDCEEQQKNFATKQLSEIMADEIQEGWL